MKSSIALASLFLVVSVNAMASVSVCDTFTESKKLGDIQAALGECNGSDGTFVVKLPAGISYRLYTHNLDKGDSCTVSESKRGENNVISIKVSLTPDEDSENCQLYMFDPADSGNHADLSITTQIDS